MKNNRLFEPEYDKLVINIDKERTELSVFHYLHNNINRNKHIHVNNRAGCMTDSLMVNLIDQMFCVLRGHDDSGEAKNYSCKITFKNKYKFSKVLRDFFRRKLYLWTKQEVYFVILTVINDKEVNVTFVPFSGGVVYEVL